MARTSYYVDGQQPVTGDGSYGNPFKTINEGVSLLGPDVDVYIRGGQTYTNEPITVPAGGGGSTLENRPRIMSYDGQVVLDGNDVGASGLSGGNQSYVEVNGDLKFINWTSDVVYVGTWGQSTKLSNWRLEGLTVHDNGDPSTDNSNYAIKAMECSDLVITNCDVRRNSAWGIGVGASSRTDALNLEVSNNVIRDCVTDGLDLSSCENATVCGNEIVNGLVYADEGYSWASPPHADGIDARGGDYKDIYIYNNWIEDFTQLIYFAADPGASRENLYIHSNRLRIDRYATVYGANAPGIFISANMAGMTVSGNVEIYSNTFGRHDAPPVWLFKAVTATWTAIVKHYNNVYDDPGDSDAVSAASAITIQGGNNCYHNCTGPAGESDNITSDPVIDSSFNLDSSSPCREAGHANLASVVSSIPTGWTDWEGHTRATVEGDMGADEYAGGSSSSQMYPVAITMMAAGTLDLNAQDLKALLLMSNSTAGDAGATGIGSDNVDAIGTLGECDATGFNPGHGNAGRLNIATAGMSISDDNATMTFDHSGDLTWTAVAADASYDIAAVLLIRPGTSDDTDAIPIAYMNVTDTPANGGNIVVALNASGIFTVTN